MKSFILAILLTLSFNVYSQIPDSCFTKKQVMDISYTLDSIFYVDSINNQIINEQKSIIAEYDSYKKLDSLIIAQQNLQIYSLKSSINIYTNERTKYYKWYNKKSVWYGLGVVSATVLIKLVIGIK